MAVTLTPAASASIVQLPVYSIAVLRASRALHDWLELSVTVTASLGTAPPEGTTRLTS